MISPTPTENSILIELEKIGLAGLVSALVALLVNYLAFNTKANEIRLSNYYKDRIDAVKMLYSLIVELHYANINLFNADSEEWDIDTYGQNLKQWLSSFSTVNKYYNKNRILLLEDGELSKKVRAKLGQLLALREVIRREHNEVISAEVRFNDIYEERDEVGKWVKLFRSKSEISQVINSFDDIRIDLEFYFKDLVSVKSWRFWRGTN